MTHTETEVKLLVNFHFRPPIKIFTEIHFIVLEINTHIDEQKRPPCYAFISCNLCITSHMQDMRFPQWTVKHLGIVGYGTVLLGQGFLPF
jgi:hypothetical protein